MLSKKFRIAPDNPYLPCPKCGNKEEFYAHADQFCEDCCYIWISCRKCSYDPFHDYENIKGCLMKLWKSLVKNYDWLLSGILISSSIGHHERTALVSLILLITFIIVEKTYLRIQVEQLKKANTELYKILERMNNEP